MSAEAANLHGVALAVGDIGLLIQGASGAGKSALAARMLAGWPFGRVRLVADDRVLVSRAGGRLVARPHPAVVGLLEVRGFGLVRAEALEAVVLRAAVRLSEKAPPRLPDAGRLKRELLGTVLPFADLPLGEAAYGRLLAIWPYLSGSLTTIGSNLIPAP